MKGEMQGRSCVSRRIITLDEGMITLDERTITDDLNTYHM